MPLSEETLNAGLSQCIERTDLGGLGTRYEGKVRDTYAQGDRLVLVTTDRISAFDHVLRQAIPFKGQVLNQLAAHFFEATADVMPNHVEAVPHPNVTVATRCEPIPLEFVVRGYLAGHAWRVYDGGGRELCGKTLPDGLIESSRLPEPILTPATKAESGHDEDISRTAAIERGLISEEDFDTLEAAALRLFERGSDMAYEQGLLLIDTKYEFGRAPDGTLLLIDEVHTPDSSRYYYADGYEARLRDGRRQRQLSKEFVREWLIEQGFQGKKGQKIPDIHDDFRKKISRRYVELFETITGRLFQVENESQPIERNINNIALTKK